MAKFVNVTNSSDDRYYDFSLLIPNHGQYNASLQ